MDRRPGARTIIAFKKPMERIGCKKCAEGRDKLCHPPRLQMAARLPSTGAAMIFR
jgi:hypothetical protein